jgi:hypothetical protein
MFLSPSLPLLRRRPREVEAEATQGARHPRGRAGFSLIAEASRTVSERPVTLPAIGTRNPVPRAAAAARASAIGRNMTHVMEGCSEIPTAAPASVEFVFVRESAGEARPARRGLDRRGTHPTSGASFGRGPKTVEQVDNECERPHRRTRFLDVGLYVLGRLSSMKARTPIASCSGRFATVRLWALTSSISLVR